MHGSRSIAAAAAVLLVGCPGGGEHRAPAVPAIEAAAPPVDPFADRVEALVRPLIDGEWMTGVSVGLIEGNAVRFYGYGRLAAADARVPDADTVYEIGSITKAFTSLVLADAVGRMSVELDHPASMYVEDGRRVPAFAGKQITLAQLASHTSGLPRMPSNFHPANAANPFADYGEDDLYAFLAGYDLPRAPGAKYEYSNLATGLLGQLLARHEGKSFEALVIERICVPLAMADTFVAVDEQHATRLAVGHDGEGRQVEGWDIPVLAGAGALRSTARDMATFVRANLSADHRVLGPAMKLTQESRVDTGEDGGSVGLGWHIARDGTRWHNGQTGGFHGYIGFRGDADIGVVVLTNTATPLGDALGQALLAMLAGEPYALELPATVRLDEDVLERYVGTYGLAADFVISISRDDSRLYVQATGWPSFRLYASSETEFYLRVADARIRFEVGADGRAKALILVQNGHAQRGPRL